MCKTIISYNPIWHNPLAAADVPQCRLGKGEVFDQSGGGSLICCLLRRGNKRGVWEKWRDKFPSLFHRVHHSALFNPPSFQVSLLQRVSPLSVDTVQSQAEQSSAASSSAPFTLLWHFLVCLVIYFVPVQYFVASSERNACSKFKGGLWWRTYGFYRACVPVRAPNTLST